MAVEIKMPQLSDTMSAGKILSWSKHVGDQVKRGDILAEVETDKANLEIESFYQGVVLEIRTPPGTNAKVGDVIAVIGQPGESIDTVASDTVASPVSFTNTNGNNKSLQSETPQSTSSHRPTSSSDRVLSSDRVKVSPLAKKIAEENDIDLTKVKGTGPLGRIVKKDIELFSQSSHMLPRSKLLNRSPEIPLVDSAQLDSAQSGPVSGKLSPLSKMRGTIARRMQEAVVTAPHFYVTVSVEMSKVESLRETLKVDSTLPGISINHFVIKAAAYALRSEPRVNRSIRDDMVFEPDQINVGIITAVEDGLLIPVIREADALSLKDLVFEAKAATERARAGRPNSSDLIGGTFSVSNMGMFDVENFTAIINPGQGGVLAISSIQDIPIVRGGHVVPGRLMKATVSVDHRVIDGVMAGNFLRYFKKALECPALMFL